MSREHPIAVFDSGIGGLTIFKAIKEILPNENILYLADNLRMPYGNRNRESIIQYTNEAIDFLIKKRVKLVVFACHTVSSTVDQTFSIPVINVIQGGVRAIKEVDSKKIAILGTQRTIQSGVYQKKLQNIDVLSIACPNLATQIETQDPQVENTISAHLEMIKDADTVLLACTHYPLVRHLFERKIDKRIHLLDSARNTALEVKEYLANEKLLNDGISQYSFYVTSSPDNFGIKSTLFLGENVQPQLVNLVEENFLSAYKR
jgi:glutamate racemase